MQITVFFLMSSVLAAAVWADQRMSDIRPGFPCAKIAEIEYRLGSVESGDHDERNVKLYSGTQGGAKARIRYQCDKGRLTEQTIIFSSTTWEHASRFAEAQKEELTERLGEPLHDGLNLSIWKRLYFGFVGGDLDYLTRVVVWGKNKDDAMLMIREAGSDQWEVVISLGSPKLEYILNT